MEGDKRPKRWLRFIGFTLAGLFFMAVGAAVALRHDFKERQALEAIRAGDAAKLSQLLDSGVSANATPWKTKGWLYDGLISPEKKAGSSQSLLAAATQAGDIEMMKLLIKRGAYVNYPPYRATRPIYLAAWLNKPVLFRFLLDQGATPDIAYKDNSLPWENGKGYEQIKAEYDFWQMKQKAKRGS